MTVNRWERLKAGITINSLKNGLTYAIPFILAGSFALVLLSVPIETYQTFISTALNGLIYKILDIIYLYTMEAMSMILILTVGYSFGKSAGTDGVAFYPITALCSYLAFTDHSTISETTNVFSVSWTFTALAVTVISCHIIRGLIRLNARRVSRLNVRGSGFVFDQVVRVILPVCVVVILFGVVGGLLSTYISPLSDKNVFSDLLEGLFARIGSNLFGAVLFMLLVHVFWFFGLHGNNLLDGVATGIFEAGMTTNAALIAQGLQPTEVFTKTFFDTFVFMGGCGAGLSFLLAIFVAARNDSSKKLGKFSLFPVLFNINEILVLGFPVVLNPGILIPFLLTPLALTVSSAAAMKLGLVPLTTQPVEWTTPIILSGYVTTGSAGGSLLQIFNVLLGALIYSPFIKHREKRQAVMLRSQIRELTEIMKTAEKEGRFPSMLADSFPMSQAAKVLASDLRYAVKNGDIEMFYQPQVHYDGTLFGAESLLRWNHPVGGYIYPPLVISIAQEDGFKDELSSYILGRVNDGIARIGEMDIPMKVSVNILTSQLEDPAFCEKVADIIERNKSRSVCVGLEFTEQVALAGSMQTLKSLESLRQMGALLIMDDFGMGHSSVVYLQDSRFDIVKLDGNLVRGLLENERSMEIVGTISHLAKTLDFEVVAEYVEDSAQREKLAELGCMVYQGYLYSEALQIDDFLQFAQLSNLKKSGFVALEREQDKKN